MLNKILKNKYQILELIIIFILTLLFNLICITISGDEIWNYGFSYNIATGLIPYGNNTIIPNIKCTILKNIWNKFNYISYI